MPGTVISVICLKVHSNSNRQAVKSIFAAIKHMKGTNVGGIQHKEESGSDLGSDSLFKGDGLCC